MRLRIMAVLAFCLGGIFSASAQLVFGDGGSLVPPCGSPGGWYFGPEPFSQQSEENMSMGTYLTQRYVNGQNYGSDFRLARWEHVKLVKVNEALMPHGVYTVQLVVCRMSTYDPCTDTETFNSVPDVIGSFTIASSNQYGQTGGSGRPYGLVSTYVKHLLEGGDDHTINAYDNPLGDYQAFLQVDGVVEGANVVGSRQAIGDPTKLRILTVSENAEEVWHCDEAGEICEGPGNNGTGASSQPFEFDYGFLDWLKVIVDPAWWVSLLWPTPEQWAELKSQCEASDLYMLLTYCSQAISGASGFMFESGSDEMVGQLGYQISFPVNFQGTEYPFTIDLEPYKWFIVIIRTLLFGSMLLWTGFWLRDRVSKALSLGLETLGEPLVDGFNYQSNDLKRQIREAPYYDED